MGAGLPRRVASPTEPDVARERGDRPGSAVARNSARRSASPCSSPTGCWCGPGPTASASSSTSRSSASRRGDLRDRRQRCRAHVRDDRRVQLRPRRGRDDLGVRVLRAARQQIGLPTPVAIVLVLAVFAPLVGLLLEMVMRFFRDAPVQTTVVVTVARHDPAASASPRRRGRPRRRRRSRGSSAANSQLRIWEATLTYDQVAASSSPSASPSSCAACCSRAARAWPCGPWSTTQNLAALNGAPPTTIARYSWILSSMLAVGGRHPARQRHEPRADHADVLRGRRVRRRGGRQAEEPAADLRRRHRPRAHEEPRVLRPPAVRRLGIVPARHPRHLPVPRAAARPRGEAHASGASSAAERPRCPTSRPRSCVGRSSSAPSLSIANLGPAGPSAGHDAGDDLRLPAALARRAHRLQRADVPLPVRVPRHRRLGDGQVVRRRQHPRHGAGRACRRAARGPRRAARRCACRASTWRWSRSASRPCLATSCCRTATSSARATWRSAGSSSSGSTSPATRPSSSCAHWCS